MKIELVPLAWVPRVWALAEPFVRSALEKSGADLVVAQAQDRAFRGEYLLLVATKEGQVVGASLVELYNDPPHRVAFVVSMGGRLITSPETFADFKAILAAQGATVIRGTVQAAVARLWRQFGFTEKHIVVETSI